MKYDAVHYISLAFKNGEKLRTSRVCGCYCCVSIMDTRNVEYQPERDGSDTGWCPLCKTDALLDEDSIREGGEKLSYALLEELHELAF